MPGGNKPGQRFIGIAFDLEAVRATDFDEDGFLRAQPDAYGESEAGVEAHELHHTFGFMSRPIAPELDPNGEILGGRACNLLTGLEGNAQHAWLGQDPRYIPFLPALKEGTSVQYGSKTPSAAAFAHFEDDGTWTCYVPVEVDADGVPTKAHICTIGIDGNGKPTVTLAHADGMAVTMLDEKIQLRNTNGEVYIELSASEFTVNGNTKISGAIVAGDVVAALELTKFAPLLAAFTELVANITLALAAKVDKGAAGPPVIVPPSLAGAIAVTIKGA